MTKFFIQDLNFEKDIGANCTSIKIGPFHFIVDAGMDPKRIGNAALPNFKLLEPSSVDFIILTHCHLDHLGGVPILMKQHPQARVLMSYPASLLSPLMLENSYSVMTRQKEEKSISEYPLFSKDDIANLQKRFLPLKYNKSYCLEKDGKEAKLTIFAAGHVLGASSVLIEYENRHMFITGDILFSDQNSLQGAQVPLLDSSDVIMIETTRGCTERIASRRKEEERLIKVIRKTLKQGGICLIPAFALGRIQELLVLLYNARKQNLYPECPIFCSGLGMALVKVFDEMGKKLPSVNFDRQILKSLNIKFLRRKKFDPRTTKLKGPAIYLLSSGMLVEHTPAYKVASCLLKDSKNAVCFVGYCDENTPGGKLLQSKPKEWFRFDELDYEVKLHAKVEKFDLSGHADREDLYEFVVKQKPKQIVLTHGDGEARGWFKQKFAAGPGHFKVLDPDVGQCYEV